MRKMMLFVSLFLAVLSFGQNKNREFGGIDCFTGTVEENLKWADAVFVGEITRTAQIDFTGPDQRIRFSFKVLEYWKGEDNLRYGQTSVDSVDIYTTKDRSFTLSSQEFKEGEKYLVYTKKFKASEWIGEGRKRFVIDVGGWLIPSPNELILGLFMCSRRAEVFSPTMEDIKILGPSKVPK